MTKKLRIFLADLKYFNRHTKRNNLIPLNIGYIASYTKARFGKDVDIHLYSDACQLLSDAKTARPDVVGLSYYYWNSELNKAVVDALRADYGSDVVIVYGGPSIDSRAEDQLLLLDRFPQVDAFTVDKVADPT